MKAKKRVQFSDEDKSGARPTPSQPFGSPLRPPSIGKKSKNDAQMGNEPVGHNNKLKNLLIVGQANSHHSEVGSDLQHLYEPKTTSPSIAPIEYNASMFSLSFYAPSFPLAPLFAPVLGHEYQLWNYYGNSPIYNLNVAQEPSMPISSQTSNDVVNILEKLVELRGIKNFEDLLKAKEEVERDLKQRKRGINKENDSPTVETEKKTDESVAKKMKKEGNKKKKSIDETEPFPRLVRRNARRGSCVGDGQTWTEEVIMF
ncbi:hypothetical protein CRE_18647 [Caenorhabditis remanei]|uniref:Uncharacterized protein n=1 Tax=Caenorhabditis remanei TaxID=31234 RepID=E3LKK8_CAERE|nr:hypothetical protein CRE_18647 [Caenorhabditis remanei]